MSDTVIARLAEFQPSDLTCKAVSAVMTIVPGSPELVPYPGMHQVVSNLGDDPALVAKAMKYVGDDQVTDVLWMSRMIDHGDRGYAIFTGVASALSLFFKKKTVSEALETDKQQRNDAVLKAFALGYLAWKAFPGTIPERTKMFAATPAGRSLLTWYAATEIGLPFADNALIGGGRLFDDFMDKYGSEQLARLSGMATGRDIDGAGEALDGLRGTIRENIDKVRPHLDRIGGAVQEYAPTVMNTADKAAGIAANVADVMPVYKMLGARLAAEGAVVRARG